jgi:hypothetical protein
MMDASESIPNSLDEARAAKLVIESKHQCGACQERFSVINRELQAGGNSICLCLTGVLV